ncbi:unnamed protein product [Chironomus riparius]|uniref:NACHT domain-containing protein n=1 Tax=Chironomus riparius TaxID=315576 RepID=A0A9N9S4U7_9DIPT|nr:unnamed protein product [Chironomus riparius]
MSNQGLQLDILSGTFKKVDEKFVLKSSKGALDNEAKNSCKILKFTSEWKLDNVLVTLSELKLDEYPNLFIFVINNTNFEFYKGNFVQKKLTRNKLLDKIRKSLKKFEVRPLILQLTSENEGATKFYYHEEKSEIFLSIKKQDKSFVKVSNFTTFMHSFLSGNFDNFEDILVEKLPKVTHSVLILRFLRVLKLSDEFVIKIIQKCAGHGTKKDFLAALDASFESDGRTLLIKSQKYLSNIINEDFDEIHDSSEITPAIDHVISMASLRDYGIQDDNKDVTSLSSCNSSFSHSNPSVLLTAIENKNKEVIDYLITYCTHLIQQLPFKHQVKISTTAFELNQIDILCDLLEMSDFPFPQSFNPDSITYQRLQRLVEDRIGFKDAIKSENFLVIINFINNNPNLKIIYNHLNISALSDAIDTKKFKVYFYLKSLGFNATVFASHEEVLSDEDLKIANKHVNEQKKVKVDEILGDVNNSVALLSARSFINNRKINKQQEAEYREKIKKWIEDVNKIKFDSKMLDIAASCESLRIIFDFESCGVPNSNLSTTIVSESLTHTVKYIIIPAKSSTNSHDQQIKGILARELCHHVINMIYENMGNPYYTHTLNTIKIYDSLVKATDKWFLNKSEFPDDECNGIISSAFKSYRSENFHRELIVRVMQILAQYDDDEQKLTHLQKKYEPLFGFFWNYVWSEMQKFSIKSRTCARKLNGIVGLLDEISTLNFKMLNSKDVKELVSSKLVIVTTNVTKFLFIDIYKHINSQFGDFIDAQNLFIKSGNYKNLKIADFLDQSMTNASNFNIFVDCSKEVVEDLLKIVNEASNFIFIVSNQNHSQELLQMMSKQSLIPTKMEINYEWNDLTVQTQQELLQRKINFQNTSNFSLYELLSKNVDPLTDKLATQEQKERNFRNFTEIIDDNLLNLLVEDETISINTKFASESVEKFLFQSRSFIKNSNVGTKLSERDFLMDTKRNKFVLISDVAGAGKSWIMKDFVNVLSIQSPGKWVTYVDLRKLELHFESQSFDFLSFMTDNVFKSMSEIEKNFFKNFYKNGKVLILFDGIDELTSDFMELIMNILTKFNSNDGNQLWIATTNHLQNYLQSKLQIEDSYKLDDFTAKESINFIVRSWVLTDLKDKELVSTQDDAENCLIENFDNYCEAAQILVEKALCLQSHTIGLPQLLTMIANIFKDNKNSDLNLKESKIFKRFVETLCEVWTSTKDENSLEMCFNFWKFHQSAALENLIPEYAKSCDLESNGNVWPEKEVNSCEMMTKVGSSYVFTHGTIAEYLVADFIAKSFKKPKINEQVLELFVKILTTERFRVIRLFLNDIIEDWDKIQEKLQKNVDNFYKIETFAEIFIRGYENLGNLVVNILKSGDYIAVTKIIFRNATNIAIHIKNPKMFSKFQELLLQFLKVPDIKKLIYREDIFHSILQSSLNIEAFDNFLSKTSEKTGPNFLREILEKKSTQPPNGNIFDVLGHTANLQPQKFQKCLSIMLKLFNNSQVFQLMEDVNTQKQNILHVCIQTGNLESFKVLWTEIEKFCASQKLLILFKKLVMQKANDDQNVLHFVGGNETLDFHETFWNLLVRTFKNKEGLKNFILQVDENGSNFVHSLVLSNNNPAVVELTMNMLEKNFTDVQFKQIIKSKGEHKRSLLQTAACRPKKLEIHQILWTTFRKLSISKLEFSKILFELDDKNENVFSNAAHSSSADVFEFMIEELEKVTLREHVKKMLTNLNAGSRNLLQIAAYDNNDKSLHESLLKIFFMYFKQPEILEIIKHVDIEGNNFFSIAVNRNSKEVVEAIWENIKILMSKEAQYAYLKIESNGVDILKRSLDNTKYVDVHEFIQRLLGGFRN